MISIIFAIIGISVRQTKHQSNTSELMYILNNGLYLSSATLKCHFRYGFIVILMHKLHVKQSVNKVHLQARMRFRSA